MDPVWIVCVLVGIFSIAGAWFNWNWFMNNSRAQGIVELLGRQGARIFYGVFGALIASIGIFMMLGNLK
jgi:small neutral amino acid transporter SnatA (MarC family)